MKGIVLLIGCVFCILFAVSEAGAQCCDYVKGDVNGSGVVNGIDVVYAVNFFKGGPPPPVRCDMCPQPAPFYAAGDVNGDCRFNGIDVTFFVVLLRESWFLSYCPSCPPCTSAKEGN